MLFYDSVPYRKNDSLCPVLCIAFLQNAMDVGFYGGKV